MIQKIKLLIIVLLLLTFNACNQRDQIQKSITY